ALEAGIPAALASSDLPPPLAALGESAVLAESSGADLAQVLRSAARDTRRSRARQAEERAAHLGCGWCCPPVWPCCPPSWSWASSPPSCRCSAAPSPSPRPGRSRHYPAPLPRPEVARAASAGAGSPAPPIGGASRQRVLLRPFPTMD